MKESQNSPRTAISEMSQFSALVASDVIGSSERSVVIKVAMTAIVLTSSGHIQFGEEVIAAVVGRLITGISASTSAVRIRIVGLMLLRGRRHAELRIFGTSVGFVAGLQTGVTNYVLLILLHLQIRLRKIE